MQMSSVTYICGQVGYKSYDHYKDERRHQCSKSGSKVRVLIVHVLLLII